MPRLGEGQLIRMAGGSAFAIASVLIFDNGFVALAAMLAGCAAWEWVCRRFGYIEPPEADEE